MHHPELHSQLVNDRTMKHLQIKQTVKLLENDIGFPTSLSILTPQKCLFWEPGPLLYRFQPLHWRVQGSLGIQNKICCKCRGQESRLSAASWFFWIWRDYVAQDLEGLNIYMCVSYNGVLTTPWRNRHIYIYAHHTRPLSGTYFAKEAELHLLCAACYFCMAMKRQKLINILSHFSPFRKNIAQLSTALHCSLSHHSASGLLCQRTHTHRAQGVHGVRHSSDEGWQPVEPMLLP